MALLIAATRGFIEISLDGIVDFDSEADLIGFGLARNAPDGLRVRKIVFIPSAINDTVVIRDGQNGPRIFSAIDLLGTWDVLKDEYRDDSKTDKGKIMSPYIHANESVVAIQNQAYVIFEL